MVPSSPLFAVVLVKDGQIFKSTMKVFCSVVGVVIMMLFSAAICSSTNVQRLQSSRELPGVTQPLDGPNHFGCVCNCNYPAHNACDEPADEPASLPHPKDCVQIQAAGHNSSGVYTVYVGRRDKPLEVYCDMDTDGGGWLVFHRREDGSEEFNRLWADYSFGFGDVYSEHWLGNVYLHSLTSAKAYELRVDMGDFEGRTRYAEYDSFRVGSPVDKYELFLGQYSAGDAGDSLAYHNGSKFSTTDTAHGTNPSCALNRNRGGNWYGNCYRVHPNGKYLKGDTRREYNGIVWRTWRGTFYSLMFMEMKIRPSS